MGDVGGEGGQGGVGVERMGEVEAGCGGRISGELFG